MTHTQTIFKLDEPDMQDTAGELDEPDMQDTAGEAGTNS